MTGGVSLSHITFLRYQDVSRRYRDVVTTRCNAKRRVAINVTIRPTSRHVATSTSRQKRWFPPNFPIVLSRHPNITTRRESNQSNCDVAITSRCVTMKFQRRDESWLASWFGKNSKNLINYYKPGFFLVLKILICFLCRILSPNQPWYLQQAILPWLKNI